MQAIVEGEVVAVKPRSYVAKDGTEQRVVEVYLRASDVRSRPDRVSCPVELAPGVGEMVRLRVVLRARSGRFGPWVSAWGLERVSD